MKIVLELEVTEAQLILDPITDRALSASTLAAKATEPELRELHDVVAKMLTSVATRLTDAIYPTCLYMHEDEPCGKEWAGEFNGHPMCRFHLELERRYAPVLS